jgi:hypothetical protein
MTVRELADRKGEPVEGMVNSEYIWGYRGYMRARLPLRVCPRRYGEREKPVTSKAEPGESSTVNRDDSASRQGKRKAREGGEGSGGNTTEEQVQITGIIENRDEPRRTDKLNQWGLTESVKKGDGNCYFYSIGEAMGLFYGQKNKAVSTELRKKVSEVLKEGSRFGGRGEPEGVYRGMIKGKATKPSEVRMLQRSEQEWVDHWIWKRCGRNYGWADTWLVPLATSYMLGKSSILMLFADSREAGSVSLLTNPKVV